MIRDFTVTEGQDSSKIQKKPGSPSYQPYVIETNRQVLTDDEVRIFETAFDKKSKGYTSTPVSRNFNHELVLAGHPQYEKVSQTHLRQKPVVDPSALYKFSDDQAIKMVADSDQAIEKSLRNIRSQRLSTLTELLGSYLSDEDKVCLAQQQSPIDHPIIHVQAVPERKVDQSMMIPSVRGFK